MRSPSQIRNLIRITFLEVFWSLRVPHNFLYQLFISAVVLILFAQINGSKGYLEVLVPGLIALVTASTAMQGLGSTVSVMRTYGAWRTVRGSPIPTSMYLGGLIFSNM